MTHIGQYVEINEEELTMFFDDEGFTIFKSKDEFENAIQKFHNDCCQFVKDNDYSEEYVVEGNSFPEFTHKYCWSCDRGIEKHHFECPFCGGSANPLH